MTCEAVQALLSAFIDGELLPHEKDQLERHLSDCTQCLRECHSLSQTKRALRSMPEHEMPEEFVGELMDIAESGYGYYPGGVARSIISRFWKPALMAGLSAATIVFAILWFVNLPGRVNKTSVVIGAGTETEPSMDIIKEKIGFQPVMPDSLPKGYRFEGAAVFRDDDDERTARFKFTDGENRFYLSEGRSKFMPVDAQIIQLKNGRTGHLCVDNDTSILHWQSEDLNFTLMGEVPHQTLINTADLFR